MKPATRQLAAIMFTDIVGYTALMGSDEEKAMSTIKSNRAIHKKLIKEYGGKWLKEMGDGTLASFKTISDAVYCAGELIKACAEEDIHLRIGIHQGEVIEEEGDIFGDGVNVASRLETLANPDEILVSESIHRNVKNKQGIISSYLGERELKNVDVSLRVYRVQIENTLNQRTLKVRNPRKPIIIAAGLAAVILIIYSLASYFDIEAPDKTIAVEKSIAVIPFWNDSSDPENDYFCNGMEEEIRIQLFKISALQIASRQSVEKYGENPDQDLIAIGKKLGVAYIVEGSIRKVSNVVRVTIQLIDTKTGHHLWAETYDGDYTSEILEFQSNAAKEIASSLNAIISPEEEKRIDQQQTNQITAYDYVIRGRYEKSLFHKSGNLEHLNISSDLYDKAIAIDPDYGDAYAYKSSNYMTLRNFDSMIVYYEKALEIDPDNVYANNRKARHNQIWGDIDLAERHYLKALEGDPNSINTNIFLGQVYCLQKNDLQKGYPYYRKAMNLIREVDDSNYDMGWALFNLGEYDKAKMYFENYFRESDYCRRIQYLKLLLDRGYYDKALYLADSICPITDCKNWCNELYIDMYADSEQFKSAEPYINDILEIETERGEFLFNPMIGYVLHHLGRIEEAEDYFKSCIKKNVSSTNRQFYTTRYYIRLAMIYAFQNRKREALNAIKVILEKGNRIGALDRLFRNPMQKNLQGDPEYEAILKQFQKEKAAVKKQIREMDENLKLDLNPA